MSPIQPESSWNIIKLERFWSSLAANFGSQNYLKIGLPPKTALLAGFCSEDQLIQTWDTLLVICEKVRKQRLAEKELQQMPSLPCFPFDPFSASTILVQRNRGTLNTSIHPKYQWHWPHTLAQIYHLVNFQWATLAHIWSHASMGSSPNFRPPKPNSTVQVFVPFDFQVSRKWNP